MTAYLVRIELRRHRGASCCSGSWSPPWSAWSGLDGRRPPGGHRLRPLPGAVDPTRRHGLRRRRAAATRRSRRRRGGRRLGARRGLPGGRTEDFYPLVVTEGGVVPFERMRAPVVEGRLPDRDAPLEVAVSERTRRRLEVGPGTSSRSPPSPRRARTSWTRTSRSSSPRTDPPIGSTSSGSSATRATSRPGSRDITLTFLTPAFREAYPPTRSDRWATERFALPRRARSRRSPTPWGEEIELDTSFSERPRAMAPTMQAIATAPRLFALVAALAGLIAIGQAIARLQQAAAERRPHPRASARGAERRWTRLFVPAGWRCSPEPCSGWSSRPASHPVPRRPGPRAGARPGLDVDGAAPPRRRRSARSSALWCGRCSRPGASGDRPCAPRLT